ncbi:MAG: vWA domain-containing protein [Desulfuromonadaceae bacterium]
MTRLPIIVLVDSSGRMHGDNITRSNKLINDLVMSLRANPNALETAYFSVSTFNHTFTPMLDFLPVALLFDLPILQAYPSTPPMLGSALTLLSDWIGKRIIPPDDAKPIVLFFWGGGCTDKADFNEALLRIDKINCAVVVVPLCLPAKEQQAMPSKWIKLESTMSDTDIIKRVIEESFSFIEAEPSTGENICTTLPDLPSEIRIN